jgi:hypothetical protein
MVFLSLLLMLLSAVACWLLCIAALPRFKRVHPAQYLAAGSPSPWTWSLGSLSFLRYLLRGEFHALDDRGLVLRLRAIRLFWLASILGVVLAFGSLLAGVGA